MRIVHHGMHQRRISRIRQCKADMSAPEHGLGTHFCAAEQRRYLCLHRAHGEKALLRRNAKPLRKRTRKLVALRTGADIFLLHGCNSCAAQQGGSGFPRRRISVKQAQCTVLPKIINSVVHLSTFVKRGNEKNS
ncbi:MAG: hypothetical protein DBX63_06890 [Clostridia bacterium]|nr:MAG: hypothetical protein DBX63_06890 [Clostridia bacterium]